jgi:hypothetical protein
MLVDHSNFEWHSNGRWFVGDSVFYTKPMAVEYASRTNQQIHFDFHNKFYDSVDWGKEPAQSLQELYRDRAEQLLSTYDYVVLLLSGGSDSTNIVKTFLNNGLRPDEVVSHGVLNKVVNKTSTCNIEVTASASKTAKLCQDAGIPYRFINLWDSINNIKYDEKFFETADTRMCIDNLFRVEGLHNDPHLLNVAKNGKKVCIVIGLEKPRVFINDGYFTTGFLDTVVMQNNYARDIKDNRGIYLERFYITPDMPEITIKQCHTIVNYFEKNVPNYKQQLVHTDKFGFQEYYDKINDILYPDTWQSKDYFSLGKTKSGIFCQKYNFIGEIMPDFDMFKQYQGVIKNFYRSVDKKYIRSNGDIAGNYGNFYKIKKVKESEDEI